jgi:hypothetical protein
VACLDDHAVLLERGQLEQALPQDIDAPTVCGVPAGDRGVRLAHQSCEQVDNIRWQMRTAEPVCAGFAHAASPASRLQTISKQR